MPLVNKSKRKKNLKVKAKSSKNLKNKKKTRGERFASKKDHKNAKKYWKIKA